ncbi:MAG: response regulator [Gammaproteobacteria bacterium]|nr:response regulator [Gammaproteobacteria bacterium]
MRRSAEILLVEDDPVDVRLMQRAMQGGDIQKHLHVARDGVEGLRFLRREGEHANAPKPDLILLDLNMPRMGGLEFLQELQAEPELTRAPVIVLTTSASDEDIISAYSLNANCYITKPADFTAFAEIIRTIETFWLSMARLPGV